jgi:hypothetical protein
MAYMNSHLVVEVFEYPTVQRLQGSRRGNSDGQTHNAIFIWKFMGRIRRTIRKILSGACFDRGPAITTFCVTNSADFDGRRPTKRWISYLCLDSRMRRSLFAYEDLNYSTLFFYDWR